MDKHILKLGIKSTDFLFPHFVKSSTGVMTVCRVPIRYGNFCYKLSHVLSSLSLPQVLLHSTQASAATHGAEAGVELATLRDGGGWKIDKVITYIRNQRPLQHVQLALYDGLNSSTASSGTTANT